MPNVSRAVVWGVTLAVSLSLSAWAEGTTADEILDFVEQKSIMGGDVGNMSATVQLDVTTDGETTNYTFRVLAVRGAAGEPDRALIVYLAPELVAGSMFLTWTPKDRDARMWLYLPALGLVKELITEEAREQEFISGSGITRKDIAEGFRYQDEYSPRLDREEVTQGMPAYVLALAPREGTSADWQSITLWVHKEEFAVIRAEFVNRNGELARVMAGDDFRTDSVGFISHRIVFRDLVTGGVAVVTLIDRETAEIPPDYFLPEKLPELPLASP
ncbi:MAG: outer membrane lipoprotein-sorting protein [Candidatus Bipolaricaulota bacterium]